MAEIPAQESTRAEETNSPKWRIGLAGFAGMIALATLTYLTYYVFTAHPRPSDVNAGNILLFSLAAVAVLTIPWKEIGFIPTEIAGVKFERLLGTQKKEQIEEFVALQAEIKELRDRLETLVVPGWVAAINAAGEAPSMPAGTEPLSAPLDEGASPPPESELPRYTSGMSDALAVLLMRFFDANPGTFFSATRVKAVASQLKGFEGLRGFTTRQIRDGIFRLVAGDKLTTSLSRRGNTLYGISRRDAARIR